MTAAEASWRPTDAHVVYMGSPYSHKQRYNVLPSMVRLQDGSLVALVEPIKLVFIRSKDGGKSWSEPYVGVSPNDVGTLSALGVRRDGRLMGVFSQSNENLGTSSVKKRTEKLPDSLDGQVFTGYRYNGDLRLGYSKDQGKTWTVGTEIDFSSMVSTWTWTMGRVLELDDGTLIVPVGGYLSRGDMDGIWLSAGVLRSSDEGATWSFSVLARGDPRLTRHGLHRASSKDGGKTWTSPSMSLPNATHCSLALLADRVLLCGYHSHNLRRWAWSARGNTPAGWAGPKMR